MRKDISKGNNITVIITMNDGHIESFNCAAVEVSNNCLFAGVSRHPKGQEYRVYPLSNIFEVVHFEGES